METSKLDMSLAAEIPLTGAIGSPVRIDFINEFGPTGAWAPLDTVVLTNTTQLYFDVSMFRQPTRLYRLAAGPSNTAPASMVLIPAGSFTLGNCMDPSEGNPRWRTPRILLLYQTFKGAFGISQAEKS